MRKTNFFLCLFCSASLLSFSQITISTDQSGVYKKDPVSISVKAPIAGTTTISVSSSTNSTLEIAPNTGATSYASGGVNVGGSGSIVPTLNHNLPVGTIPGSPSVGPDGSANYTIPISLPPGTNNMVPKLDLQYNSNAGEGILGMGWSFSLSSIVRVNYNQYVDQKSRSVMLDNSDALALDGNRMLVVSGSNFAQGAVYRLEDENYTRITYTVSGGISYFLAETKQGLKMEYGSTTDSKLKLGTGTTAADYQFLLSKVYDNFGNYILYSYNNDATNNEVTLKQIDYTGNDAQSISPYNSLKFYYDDKDADNYDSKYVNGFQLLRTHLLKEIDVFCGSSNVKKYEFTYAESDYHNYLNQIDYTDYDGKKLNPTIFNYGGPTGSPLSTSYNTTASGLVYAANGIFPYSTADLYTGDFNGDGRSDILAMNYNSQSLDANFNVIKDFSGQNFQVYYASSLAGFTQASASENYPANFNNLYGDFSPFYATDFNFAGNPRTFGTSLRDFNGDGKSDLPMLTTSGNTSKVFLYYGDNTSTSGFTVGTHTCTISGGEKITFGDVDGDGKVEGIIYHDPSAGSSSQDTQLKIYDFSTGTSYGYFILQSGISGVTFGALSYTGLSAVDIDGDGADELYAIWNGSAFYIRVTKPTSSTFSAKAYWKDPTPPAALINHEDYYGDFNGDGILDFTRVLQDLASNMGGSGGTTTAAGLRYGMGGNNAVSGGSSASVVYANSDAYHLAKKYFSADFNGDHKTDLIEIVSNYCDGTTTTPNTLDVYFWDSDKPGSKTHLGNIGELSVFNYNFSDATGINDLDMDGAPGLQVFTGTSANIAQLPTFLTGDFNGDGREDILIKIGNSGIPGAGSGCTNNATPPVYLILSLKPENTEHLLTTVYDGYNRESDFAYGSTSVNNHSIYQTLLSYYTTGATALTFPLKKCDGPMWVVTEMDNPDGIGGTNTDKYTYKGGATHLQGKGFIGFDQQVTVNSASGITSTATFTTNTSFFERFPKSITNVLTSNSSTTVSTTTYSYTTLAPSGASSQAKVHFSFLKSKKEIENGTTGFVSQTSYTYNSDGNITQTISSHGTNVPVSTVESTTVATSGFNAPNTTTHDTWLPTWPLDFTTTTQRGSNPNYPRTQNYAYTPEGKVQTEIQDQGTPMYVQIDYVYDPAGVLTSKSVTAPTGGTSGSALPVKTYSSVYDNLKRFVTQTINPLNQTSFSDYDSRFGSLIYTKDITNLETYKTFDGEGRLIKVVTPDNLVTTTTYNWITTAISASGEPISTYGPFCFHKVLSSTTGKPSVLSYFDIFDREIFTQIDGYNPSKPICKAKIYDAYGNIKQQTGPYYKGSGNALTGLVTTNVYDNFKRLTNCTTTYAGLTTPNITGYAYNVDAVGNYSVTVTTPDTRKKTTFTDASGSIAKTIDDLGEIVNFDYWSNRKVKTISLGATGSILTQQRTYDNYARPYQLIEPNSGTTIYKYNAYGLLESTTDARPVTILSTYDALDRITTKTSPDGVFTYQYVQSGNGRNLLQVEAAPGTSCKYSYDNLNHIIQKSKVIAGNTYNTSFEYDAYNNITKVTYPGGFAITQGYTGTSYLDNIKRLDNGAVIWKANEMIPFGQYNKYTLGNGQQTAVDYNNFDMPKQFNAGTIFNYKITPNIANGNILDRTDVLRGLTETFQYDNMNRLSASTISSDITTVAYDPSGNGNITSKTASGANGSNLGTYDYRTAEFNELNTVENLDLSISANPQAATYNSFSKLATLAEGDFTYNLAYGPDMQRTQSVLNNVMLNTQYTRDYVSNYEKTIGTGNFSREISYINAPSGLCAMYVKNGPADTLYFVYTDHLGSILKLTDASGVNRGEQSFDTWGRYRNVNNWSYANPQIIDGLSYRGFTGHEHLTAFDLINMNGRLYDSKLGLFLSIDPLLAKTPGISPYHYANNNPLKYTDPTGTTGESTHTDEKGNVLAVYDDGDLGVYKHKKITEWDGKKVLEKNGKDVEKVGQTMYWDEFAKHDASNHIIETSPGNYADPSAKILFGVRAEPILAVYGNYARQEMDRHFPAITWLKNNSARGAVLDIKDKIGHSTGYLLGEHYVTGESVGNFLFGENLFYAMPFYYEQPDWWHFTMQHVGHYHNQSNKVHNPEVAPYYGEIESSGRWIENGFTNH